MNNKPAKKMLSRLWLAVAFLLIGQSAFAQEQAEMADAMRSNGKIYVVVAVCLIILVGLFLYVMNVDRKLRKLEKDG